MESLKLSFNAIAPIFILMLIGYSLKKLKVADKKTFDSINKIGFKVFLPVLVFYNIYKTEIDDVLNVKLIWFSIIGIFAVFVVGYFAVLVLTKDNAKRGVMLQGFFRSNFVLLGMPLVEYIYGEGAGGLTSVLLGIIIPVFNVLAIIALVRFCGGQGKMNIGQVLKGIITNPLIIGCIVGLAVVLTGLKLPALLEESVKDISSVATPLAIIVLGAEFEYSTIKESLKELLITVGARLIFIPLVMLTVAVMLGFMGEALVCILITFASPMAVSSFTMAQQMGGDEHLAAHMVIMSSALCLITLFGWIFALSYLGLL